ncbi:MAG: hypothetical protein ABI151_05655 [Chitinophagaceae bacterium]
MPTEKKSVIPKDEEKKSIIAAHDEAESDIAKDPDMELTAPNDDLDEGELANLGRDKIT